MLHPNKLQIEYSPRTQLRSRLESLVSSGLGLQDFERDHTQGEPKVGYRLCPT